MQFLFALGKYVIAGLFSLLTQIVNSLLLVRGLLTKKLLFPLKLTKLRYFKLLHALNGNSKPGKESLITICEVSKFDKSNDIKEEQPENIPSMLRTLLV